MRKRIAIDHICTLNEYVDAERSNKFAGAKLKKKYTGFFEKAFLSSEQITEPVKIEFIWHLNNARRDLDNISFMQKFILDGMVKAGTLKGDGLKYIQGLIHTPILERDLQTEYVEIITNAG